MKSDNFLLVYKDGQIRFGSYILHFIHKKIITDREDFILVIVGRKGRGKSYSSMEIADVWSQGLGVDFNVEDNIKHTVKSTLQAINSGNLVEGSPIIIEEMGVIANNREFMSTVNKVLSFIAQTVRTKHYLIIVNVPKWKMIDKSVRMLANARLEIQRKSMKEQCTYGKFYLLEYEDTQREKEWRRFLRFKVMNKRKLFFVRDVKFHIPRPELCVAYEEKKAKYTQKLYADLESSLEPEMGEIDANVSGMGSSQAGALYLFNEQRLNMRQIARVFGVRLKVVASWIRAARESGQRVRRDSKNVSDSDFDSKGVLYWRSLVKENVG